MEATILGTFESFCFSQLNLVLILVNIYIYLTGFLYIDQPPPVVICNCYLSLCLFHLFTCLLLAYLVTHAYNYLFVYACLFVLVFSLFV